MNRNDYLAAITDAYRGERIASRVLNEVCAREGTGWSLHETLLTMIRLEDSMADMLRPIMARHTLPLADAAEIDREARASGMASLSWPEMMAQLRRAMPAIVARYDDLAAEAEPDDRDALALFAEHERALDTYAGLESADDAGRRRALDWIENIIARAEALERA